ncbi:hypothetical protein SAMN04487886_100711 [Clostridium sp. DSM 8431]|nr:hypothetical protein [Clostridium sp. DSM 8431]SFU32503.1 hypothetical protein SAMN04487886_100711 [Clostridium sp. DSM 8431]
MEKRYLIYKITCKVNKKMNMILNFIEKSENIISKLKGRTRSE